MVDLLEQAVAAHRSGRIAEAEKLYATALKEQPARADARYNLGVIFGQTGRIREALREFTRATETKPDFGDAWLMRAECADHLGDFEDSLISADTAKRLAPGAPRGWFRYGLALNRLGRNHEAVDAHRQAVTLDPNFSPAWVNLCISYKNTGRPEDAFAAIRHAIEYSGQTFATDELAENHYGLLHWHLALLELALGSYKDGFAHFRARFKGGTNWKRPDVPQPLWRSQDLKGKKLLVTAEQGHGDVLMMARYLPLLQQKGAHVIFQTHPALVRYFTAWNGADTVLTTGSPYPLAFDYHVPVFDLPYCFGTTLTTIPAADSYLPKSGIDAANVLPASTGKKVGIIWAGQPDNMRDKLRSLSAQDFTILFAIQGFSYYSLTRDLRPGDTELLAKHAVTNLAPQLGDFADSAGLIAQMDLVITCDTATAHLAGGLGKQVWILLPFVPDWRWGYREDSTPWYRSARLFRQRQSGDWRDVIEGVKSAMAEL